MQHAAIIGLRNIVEFQSSPDPEVGCNTVDSWFGFRGLVSILTRPGGRVQRIAFLQFGDHQGVSILTRPGGRVQRQGCLAIYPPVSFQSSPDPEVGCNG